MKPTEGRPIKKNGYSHAKADAKRDRKRQDAEARQGVYDGLTLRMRLARTLTARGQSKRQRARLEHALAVEKEKSRSVA